MIAPVCQQLGDQGCVLISESSGDSPERPTSMTDAPIITARRMARYGSAPVRRMRSMAALTTLACLPRAHHGCVNLYTSIAGFL